MKHTISVHVDLDNGGSAHVESGGLSLRVAKDETANAWRMLFHDTYFETFAQAVGAAVELAVEGLPT